MQLPCLNPADHALKKYLSLLCAADIFNMRDHNRHIAYSEEPALVTSSLAREFPLKRRLTIVCIMEDR